MKTDAGARCTRLMTTLILVATTGLIMAIVGGCQSEEPGTEDSELAVNASTLSDSAESPGDGQGVQLAKKILATFDELIAEVAALANDKPESAALKPQLEQLYEAYAPTMGSLNEEYLALLDLDIAQFGECNTYLGDYRGQHVAAKDNVLAEALRYYNLELGDQEIVALLSSRPIELLEIAVAQD